MHLIAQLFAFSGQAAMGTLDVNDRRAVYVLDIVLAAGIDNSRISTTKKIAAASAES